MAEYLELPDVVKRAIVCGPVPRIRPWRDILRECREYKADITKEMTVAERLMAFCETYLKVPEGDFVGQPVRLALFQEAYFSSVFDAEEFVRLALLSMARKNSKTTTLAMIILGHVVGPLTKPNSDISSGARSRKQAATVYKLMAKMVMQSPQLSRIIKLRPSEKSLVGLPQNVHFEALAAEASTAMGRSDRVVLLDELGQVAGETDEFADALISSQGAYDDGRCFVISTQAATDSAMMSLMIDDAVEAEDPNTVVHLYTSEAGCSIDDRKAHRHSNPALGLFRSQRDLDSQIEKAKRIPSREAGARNLLLNQRISQQNVWLAPSVWKRCRGAVDLELFQNPDRMTLGLDLSSRNDLTAAVLAAKDHEGLINLLPFVFTPSEGLRERAKHDKAPYELWVKERLLFAIPGKTVTYSVVVSFLKLHLESLGIDEALITDIEFDRWRIDLFKQACEDEGFLQAQSDDAWHSIGQGYKDFSPRCEDFESSLIEGRVRHGNHPLLNMAAANALSIKDPAGAIKLDKRRSTARIDPLVAAVMAHHPLSEGVGAEDSFDAAAIIG